MGTSIAKLQMEREIISKVQENPTSVEGLSDSTGYPYYTCVRIVKDLTERGIIKVQGTLNRHRIYAFNADSASEGDFIPRLTDLVQKRSIKAVLLIDGVGNEDDLKATHAVKNIPRYATELMMAVHYASNGQDVGFRLDSIRERMQKDFLYARNAAHLLEQMLKEPRFWESSFLAEMANDEDFHYLTIQEAMDYYDTQS